MYTSYNIYASEHDAHFCLQGWKVSIVSDTKFGTVLVFLKKIRFNWDGVPEYFFQKGRPSVPI